MSRLATAAPSTESLRWSGHWIGHRPRPATGTPADFLTGVEPSREFSRCMFRRTFDLEVLRMRHRLASPPTRDMCCG
jgi:hypothetical protein